MSARDGLIRAEHGLSLGTEQPHRAVTDLRLPHCT